MITVMGKFKQSLYRFFYGRYGSDTLNKTLLGAYIVILILHTVVSLFVESALLSLLYFVLSISLIVWIFSRMFSRNIVARRRENEKFCAFFRLRRNKLRDRKTHIYKKCPSCRAVLRLPKAKGKHAVVCPRCKHRFFVGR